MAARRDSAALPYVIGWYGAIAPLAGQRGELAARKSHHAAQQLAKGWRDRHRSWTPGWSGWFVFTVTDARSGEVLDRYR